MAKGYEVLEMLIPTGGWVIVGDDYEGITFLECEPITKKAFENGFAKVDAYLAEKEAARIAARESRRAKLLALGLTEEELDA